MVRTRLSFTADQQAEGDRKLKEARSRHELVRKLQQQDA